MAMSHACDAAQEGFAKTFAPQIVDRDGGVLDHDVKDRDDLRVIPFLGCHDAQGMRDRGCALLIKLSRMSSRSDADCFFKSRHTRIRDFPFDACSTISPIHWFNHCENCLARVQIHAPATLFEFRLCCVPRSTMPLRASAELDRVLRQLVRSNAMSQLARVPEPHCLPPRRVAVCRDISLSGFCRRVAIVEGVGRGLRPNDRPREPWGCPAVRTGGGTASLSQTFPAESGDTEG